MIKFKSKWHAAAFYGFIVVAVASTIYFAVLK